MIEIPANETDIVRVFAVNGDSRGSGTAQSFLSRLEQTPEAIAAEADRLRDMLGATTIDPTYTETFAVKDVSDMGLSQYIASAMDVPADRLAPDRARFDALEGEVLIVLSRALGLAAQTLRPGPELTFIGAYQMAEAPLTGAISPMPVTQKPAPDEVAPPEASPPDAPRVPKPALIALLGLGLAALIVLFITGGTTP